jgi:uncharacterized protein
MVLILTAAWFHDLGFVERYKDNEIIAARIATEILPLFHYSPADVAAVDGMIMATRLPQTPHNLLEQIVADADLDVLGRDDFLQRNRFLRDELFEQDITFTNEEWYSTQLAFMREHHYFTAPACKLRNAVKAQNVALLEALLQRSRDS